MRKGGWEDEQDVDRRVRSRLVSEPRLRQDHLEARGGGREEAMPDWGEG